jgi:hypothetical protein
MVSSMVWYGLEYGIECGMVMIWYGMTVWYGMAWYGAVQIKIFMIVTVIVNFTGI